MRIIRRDEGRQVRRKNLAGVTQEMVVVPEGANTDDFVWRISWSEVDDNAALWPFPGVDRTLVLLEGRGLALDFGGGTVVLGTGSAPLCFPGEAPVVGWLNAGNVTEFHVMTRRGQATHRVQLLDVPGQSLPPDCTAFMCRDGVVTIGGETLVPGDCALLPPGQQNDVALGGRGRIIAVTIELMNPVDTSIEHLDRYRPGRAASKAGGFAVT